MSKNFAITVIASAPSPAESGTTLAVPDGHGSYFPATPFNAVCCPPNELPSPDNAEVIRVTDITDDTFTFERAQEFTTAKNIEAGWRIFQSLVYDNVSPEVTALEQAISVVTTNLNANVTTLVAADNALSDAISVVSNRVSVVSTLATAADLHANTASAAATSVYNAQLGIQELFIPIGAFRPHVSSGCSPIEDLTLAVNRYVAACAFSPTTLQLATISFTLPKAWNRGTITFQPYWVNMAGGSGGVVWGCQAVAYGDGETMDTAVGTAQEVTDTALGAEVLAIGPESLALTIAGTPQINDLIRLDVYRSPANAGDTYAANAYLIGIKLRLTTNAPTDA